MQVSPKLDFRFSARSCGENTSLDFLKERQTTSLPPLAAVSSHGNEKADK